MALAALVLIANFRADIASGVFIMNGNMMQEGEAGRLI